jgi:hypothetical protein
MARPYALYCGGAANRATSSASGTFAMSNDERTARIEHENKMIRRLRFLVDLTFATIAQDDSITLEEAWDHVRALKAAALTMFPGKDQTFDLIYLPRFSRLLAERFRAN